MQMVKRSQVHSLSSSGVEVYVQRQRNHCDPEYATGAEDSRWHRIYDLLPELRERHLRLNRRSDFHIASSHGDQGPRPSSLNRSPLSLLEQAPALFRAPSPGRKPGASRRRAVCWPFAKSLDKVFSFCSWSAVSRAWSPRCAEHGIWDGVDTRPAKNA